jgi:L-lactate dehydrogenase complex protein LldG
MNAARTQILQNLRNRLGRTPENSEAARRAARQWLNERAGGPRPELGTDLVDRFLACARVLSSTTDRVTRMDQAPAAVARYLAGERLPASAVCAAQVAGLAWSAAGIGIEVREARDADPVGITGCFCAIADTGTVMLCSAPDSPAAVSLLPETHIALVPVARIVPHMEDAWRLAREELGELPRAVVFVSGPSRTGDIEQTIVLGAHGPYRVHVILTG